MGVLTYTVSHGEFKSKEKFKPKKNIGAGTSTGMGSKPEGFQSVGGVAPIQTLYSYHMKVCE